MIRRILTCGMFGLLLVISTTACGGDDTTGGPAGPSGPATTADPDGATTTRPTASTAAPATTTTTTPPYSFDGSVPPPDLVNTGTDYVAIAESLDRYRKWLAGHHPDPALLENAYVPGSQVYEAIAGDLRELRSREMRLIDVGHHLEVSVTKAQSGVVTLMLTETAASVRLVDAAGQIVEEKTVQGETRYFAVLAMSESDRWRVADVTRLDDDVRVQL